jgi:hypothetical protein
MNDNKPNDFDQAAGAVTAALMKCNELDDVEERLAIINAALRMYRAEMVIELLETFIKNGQEQLAIRAVLNLALEKRFAYHNHFVELCCQYFPDVRPMQ